jgi:hypothetical protein
MRQIRAALARVAGVFTRDDPAADMRAEFEAHLDMETAELIRRGMAPDEARRQALLASGGLTQAAEAVRDQRGLPWLESIGEDVRYAFRTLRHSPAFTTVVVLTLALGIGANTAIFSVVRAVVLKPLPHDDGERLVYLRHSTDAPGGESIAFSVPEGTERIPDIRPDALQPRQPALVSHRFGRLGKPTRREERLPARLVRRHPAPDEFRCFHLEMDLELGAHVIGGMVTREQARDSRERGSDLAHQVSCGGARKAAIRSAVWFHSRASRWSRLRPAAVSA